LSVIKETPIIKRSKRKKKNKNEEKNNKLPDNTENINIDNKSNLDLNEKGNNTISDSDNGENNEAKVTVDNKFKENLGELSSFNNSEGKDKEEIESLREELNLDKDFKADEEVLELNNINRMLEENKKVDYFELLLRLEKIGKNLEELMLDIDKKLYYNVELKEKIENMEKKLEEISMLMEEVILTGEKAVLYYIKKNKGKPIKLKELYKRFDKKIVDKVIEELYEKRLIKILK
jgi:hypothetical protein